jgi:2-polyprenyl-3-methyl-5-hydroxy-6-metoxy-1,4-benzoquinol methylase
MRRLLSPFVGAMSPVIGFVDIINGQRVAGWVWDKSQPERRLTISISVAGRVIGETVASLHRPDLAEAGIGDGRHAFDFPFENNLSDREADNFIVHSEGFRLPVRNGARRPTPSGLITDDAIATEMPAGAETVQDRAAARWDENYSTDCRPLWTSNHLVLEEIFRRMTGTTKFWLCWAFEDYLKHQPKRLLSIGCGDGGHELIIARNRYAAHVDAFDISAGGITSAQQAARSEGLSNVNFYVESFEGFVASPPTATYDLIMFAGSLHHVRDVEGVLGTVRRILEPDGIIMFEEFIGPVYMIFPQPQVAIVNAMLDAIAPEFKTSPAARWVNPSIEAVFSHDPSESVRAPLILPLLEAYFDVVWKRYFGGALLQPAFTLLDCDRLNDGSPESSSVVRLLIESENALTEARALEHNFCWGFCKQRG